jgi:NAD-dependent dihydropyrimidine dehydrogenase PreA subunit
MLNRKGQVTNVYIITVNEDTCEGCGDCVGTCPNEMFELVDKKAQTTGNPDDCIGCESCVAVCPTGSITLQEM